MRALFVAGIVSLVIFGLWRTLWLPMAERTSWAEHALTQCSETSKQLQLQLQAAQAALGGQQAMVQQEAMGAPGPGSQTFGEGGEGSFSPQTRLALLHKELLPYLDKGLVIWLEEPQGLALQLNQWHLPVGPWRVEQPDVVWLHKLHQLVIGQGWWVRTMEWIMPPAPSLSSQSTMGLCWQRWMQLGDSLEQQPAPQMIWRAAQAQNHQPHRANVCPGQLVWYVVDGAKDLPSQEP